MILGKKLQKEIQFELNENAQAKNLARF